ncbi:MAG: hypothetical protein CSA82_01140 [Actinobacteria bacterium]|nr:MAG: hypothetical protein CSA82_01140 [Actinomycetota bacterium]
MNEIVSVYDMNFDRAAKNLSANRLSDAVRPWFEDYTEPAVMQAVEDLQVPSRRRQAAHYLGLELEIAA